MARTCSYEGRQITGRPMRIMWYDVPGCPPGGPQSVPEELSRLYESIPLIANGLADGSIIKTIVDDGVPPPPPPPVYTYGEGLVSLDEAMPIIEKYGSSKNAVRKMLRNGDIPGAYKAGTDANDPWVIPKAELELVLHTRTETEPEPEPTPEPTTPEE